MSGDSFNPDEGGEPIKIINPDEENVLIEADPEPEDAMDAAELEAAKDYTAADNADPEEAESGVEDADPPHSDDAGSGDPDEDGKATADKEGETQEAVEFDPSSLPEPAQKQFDAKIAELDAKAAGADKYFNTKARELAAKSRELDVLLSEARASSAEARNTGQPKPDTGPPPIRTGEGVTEDQYLDDLRKSQEWYAQKALQDKIDAGDLVTGEQYASVINRTAVQDRMIQIQSIDGYTPDVESKMMEIAAADQSGFWQRQLAENSDGVMQLARMAVSASTTAKEHATAASKEAATIKKQSTAASRTTPRITTPKGAVSEDVFAKQGFKNENEAMDYAEKEAREQYGG